jgi:hypothetical protein
MPLGKNQINLLPSKSLLPRQTALLRRKVMTISVVILGVYLAVAAAIFVYLGVLAVQKTLLSQSIDKEIAQLATYKEIEASQQLIKSKLIYLQTSLQTEPSASLALRHLEELFPLPLALTNLQLGQKGAVEAEITASGSSGLISPENDLEAAKAKELFSGLTAVITEGANGKITLSLKGRYLTSAIRMTQ